MPFRPGGPPTFAGMNHLAQSPQVHFLALPYWVFTAASGHEERLKLKQ